MRLLLLSAVLALSGCMSMIVPSSPPMTRFVLHPLTERTGNMAQGAVAVEMPSAPHTLDTNRVALKRGGKWDYYDGAKWADFLPPLVQADIIKTLRQSGLYKTVGSDEDNIDGRSLKIDITSFHADYTGSGPAPLARVALTATFGGTTFSVAGAAPASANTLSAIQPAFNEAFAQAQRQLVEKLKRIR